MKYNGIIENNLRVIEQKLDEINSWEIDSFEKLKNSTLLQNASERALQVAIEMMIDICERISAIEKIQPLDSSSECIAKLQEMKIIRPFPEYKEMVKFRNFIVHRYERIDVEIIYSILKNKIQLFGFFIEDIRNS